MKTQESKLFPAWMLSALPFVLIFAVVCGNLAVYFWAKAPHMSRHASEGERPVYAAVPEFELTERDGSTVKLSDLKNKIWIADFIFTRCQAQCPLLSSRMELLHKELPGILTVSFTVDPEFDTPTVLSEYAGRFSADKQWFFLTGPKERIDRVAKGLHVNGPDEPVFHSASFVLVDGSGQVRGYYGASDEASMEKLKHDVRLLKRS